MATPQPLEIFLAAVTGAYLVWAWTSTHCHAHRTASSAGRLGGLANWAGLSHSWAMYSPDPIQMSRLMSARVVLADGRVIEEKLFRIAEVGVLQGFLRMRESRFQDALCNGREPGLRQSLCEFIAKRCAASESVVSVELVCTQQRVIYPPNRSDLAPSTRVVLYNLDLRAAAHPVTPGDWSG